MIKRINSSNAGKAILIMEGCSIVLQIMLTVLGFTFDNNIQLYIFFALNQLCILIAACVASYGTNYNVFKNGLLGKGVTRSKMSLNKIFYIIIITVGLILVGIPLSNLFLLLLESLSYDVSAPMPSFSGPWIIAAFVTIVIMPAIFEELIMRGVVLESIKSRGYLWAIVVSAGIFAVMHGSPLQLVHQFIVGLVIAFLVIVSRNIWAGILLHFFNNLFAIAIDCFYQSGSVPIAEESVATALTFVDFIPLIIMMGIGLTLIIFALQAFVNQCVRDKEHETNTRYNKALTFSTDSITELCVYMNTGKVEEEEQVFSELKVEAKSHTVPKEPLAMFFIVAVFVLITIWIFNTAQGFGLVG